MPLEPIDRLAPQYTSVLARALAKTPSARFASAAEFAVALAAVPNRGPAPDLTMLAPAAMTPADGPGSADHFDPEWLDTLGRELAGHLGPIAGHWSVVWLLRSAIGRHWCECWPCTWMISGVALDVSAARRTCRKVPVW